MPRPLAHAPVSAPIALFADVHGNLEALEAVLAEVGQRGVSGIYVAGDLLFGGQEPLAVWKRLVEVKARCVRGASDLALATLDPSRLVPKTDLERQRRETFLRTREAVGELVLRYLERLPDALRVPMVDGREIVVVHGSPAAPTLEIGHDMPDEEVLALIGDDPADIVACGGSHVAFQRAVSEVRVLGLGSVGESPEGGVAHYAIVTPRLDGTLVEQSWVRFGAHA